jgi:hypothetical protein
LHAGDPCPGCGKGKVYPQKEGIGPEKYDETTTARIALLKYGSGMPFYRLEKLEHLLGDSPARLDAGGDRGRSGGGDQSGAR